MLKRTRTILFLICLFLFFLIAPLIILYSQGYRIDINSKKIIKTGGFYFNIWPEGAEIFLDGKFQKKTSFMSNSAYINDLKPKEYKIEIKKEGFHPWQKNVEIKENLVISFNDIFLIPENPKYINLTQKAEDFFFSPDGRKVILKEGAEKGWNLKIIELDINLKSNLFSGFESPETELLDLKFCPDSEKILFSTKEKEKQKRWILELESPIQEKKPVDLISLDFLGEKVTDISFNPDDSQKMFFVKESVKENSLFEVNLSSKKINSNPTLRNLMTYEISDGNLFWLSKNGFILKTNLAGETEEKLNLKPLSIKEEKKYQIYIKNSLIFLKEDNTVYIFNSDSQIFEKLSDFTKELKLSPDGKKIVYFSNYEIWILFLEKKEGQPKRELLEKLFLTRFSEKIDQVLWYNSNYLIFNIGNKIKISEIDNRDNINICDFSEFNSPKIFFNQFDKKLYILSEENLFSSEKLLP
jgi:hypothetical protein